MKPFNNFSSRKEWEIHIWQEFVKSIGKTKSEKELSHLLNIVLTQKEKDNIIKRLIAFSLIKKGMSYNEIGEISWLSPTTISAAKKCLTSGLEYKNYRAILKNKKIKSIKEKSKLRNITFDDLGEALEDFIKYIGELPIPPITGRGRWKFLKVNN